MHAWYASVCHRHSLIRFISERRDLCNPCLMTVCYTDQTSVKVRPSRTSLILSCSMIEPGIEPRSLPWEASTVTTELYNLCIKTLSNMKSHLKQSKLSQDDLSAPLSLSLLLLPNLLFKGTSQRGHTNLADFSIQTPGARGARPDHTSAICSELPHKYSNLLVQQLKLDTQRHLSLELSCYY